MSFDQTEAQNSPPKEGLERSYLKYVQIKRLIQDYREYNSIFINVI